MDETAPARTYGEGQGAARGALLRLEPGRVSEAANSYQFGALQKCNIEVQLGFIGHAVGYCAW